MHRPCFVESGHAKNDFKAGSTIKTGQNHRKKIFFDFRDRKSLDLRKINILRKNI